MSRARSRLGTFLSISGSVAFGYILWRSSAPLVWSDTPLISDNLFEFEELRWRGIATLLEITRTGFNNVGSDGYRPLSRVIGLLGTALFSDPDTPTIPWYAVIGLLIGLTAFCFFLVAGRFLRSNAAAVLAVFLLLFTPSVLVGAWVVFQGIQVIVPLLICGGLLLYWRSLDQGRSRACWRAGLCAVMAFGPWFREFIGVLPLMVILLEARRARRPTVLMVISGLALLHAVYPTALIAWLVYPDLPLTPVFAMGHLGTQLRPAVDETTGGTISRLASDIRWTMPLHFLSLYPPLALLLGFVALMLPALGSFIGATNPDTNATRADYTRAHRRFDWARGLVVGFTIAIPSWLLVGDVHWLALWLCLGFVVLGAQRDGFLALWFIVTFAPFLKIFTEHVHLAYAAMPASIILAGAVEDVWRALQSDSGPARAMRYVVAAVLLVASGDHALNAYGSHQVVHGVNHGTVRVADWLRANVPEGSVIVTNAIHGEDIRLFSDGHVKVYYTVTAGVPRDCDTVADPPALSELIRQNYGRRTVYFLDVDFEYAAEKETYHSHKYVRARSVEMEDLGVVHVTRVRYPYLDPLKGLVPRAYIPFLGPPDLENDFYRGPALGGTPFVREVHAEYGVYRVTGTVVSSWEPKGPVELVTEGYQGFNVLRWNERYFAIPQGEGPFDLKRIGRRGYSRSFVADSYDALLAQVEAPRELRAPKDEGPYLRAKPALAHPGYRGFKLVRYDGTVYAIPHGTDVDPRQFRRGASTTLWAGDSVAAVQTLIDRRWHAMGSARATGQATQMVHEGYRRFNILALNDRYFAVPQEEGSFDLQLLRQGRYSKSFAAETYDEIVARIDAAEARRLLAGSGEDSTGVPVLLRAGYKGYNVIRYDSQVYAIPDGEEAFDPRRIRFAGYSRALVADTEALAIRRIDRKVAMAQAVSSRRAPVLLEQGYKGFNLVAYDGRVYGFPQRDGPFDSARVRRKTYRPLFVGCSVRQVAGLIDRSFNATE